MEHIDFPQPSFSSVALPFLVGVAAASVVALVLHAAGGIAPGGQYCHEPRQAAISGELANGGKARVGVQTFAMGTSVIAGLDRLRAVPVAEGRASVSYIRCLNKAA